MPLLDTLSLPSSSSSQQPFPHSARSISSLSIHKPQTQALTVGFGICTTMSEGLMQISLTQMVLGAGDHSRGCGLLLQLPPSEQSPPSLPCTVRPYLCLRGSFPALFSSSSNLLRASSSWVRGLGAGLGGMVGSWMKG